MIGMNLAMKVSNQTGFHDSGSTLIYSCLPTLKIGYLGGSGSTIAPQLLTDGLVQMFSSIGELDPFFPASC